jgi:hypothetical protein
MSVVYRQRRDRDQGRVASRAHPARLGRRVVVRRVGAPTAAAVRMAEAHRMAFAM